MKNIFRLFLLLGSKDFLVLILSLLARQIMVRLGNPTWFKFEINIVENYEE